MVTHPENRRTSRNNTLLLLLVAFLIFGIGIFPREWRPSLYALTYTATYFVGILALETKSRQWLYVSIPLILLQWISIIYDLEVLTTISTGLNFSFFAIISFMLVRQVALAKRVTPRVILEAINGYLLMGLVFSLITVLVSSYDPEAINLPILSRDGMEHHVDFSDCLYYSFISITTMGYGDFVPKAAYTRSLATLMGVAGQLYIAVLIALLVGKYNEQRINKKES